MLNKKPTSIVQQPEMSPVERYTLNSFGCYGDARACGLGDYYLTALEKAQLTKGIDHGLAR